MIWLLASLSFAEPPTCSTADLEALPKPADTMAVAWVAPWSRRPSGWLKVVPTVELSGWLAAQDPPWTGRTLQRLGLRRRGTDPKRRWQVRVYEVDRDQLCRPIATVEQDVIVAGLPACPARISGEGRKTAGCGHTLDRKTGEEGPTLFALKVGDVRDRGYCVVPLDRYIEQAGRVLR
ncbi:MAG: hypothetical protein AB8H79_09920 [Myxococcota bacterium]